MYKYFHTLFFFNRSNNNILFIFVLRLLIKNMTIFRFFFFLFFKNNSLKLIVKYIVWSVNFIYLHKVIANLQEDSNSINKSKRVQSIGELSIGLMAGTTVSPHGRPSIGMINNSSESQELEDGSIPVVGLLASSMDISSNKSPLNASTSEF